MVLSHMLFITAAVSFIGIDLISHLDERRNLKCVNDRRRPVAAFAPRGPRHDPHDMRYKCTI